jgi:hypothetical protein
MTAEGEAMAKLEAAAPVSRVVSCLCASSRSWQVLLPVQISYLSPWMGAIGLQGSEEAEALAEEVKRWQVAKEAGNAELQAISDYYKDRMAAIRMDAK